MYVHIFDLENNYEKKIEHLLLQVSRINMIHGAIF